MKKILLLISCSAISLLTSCNTNNGDNINTPTELQEKVKDPKAKGGNKCLLDYANDYPKLLTKEMVASAAGISADIIATSDTRITKSNEYHDVTHSWKTGRIKNMYGMEVAVDDYVKLTGITAISLDMFKLSYKAVSAEDLAKLQQKTNEAVDGKSDNKAVNEKLKKLDEMGISKEKQKEMMESMANSAQKMTEGFMKIDNLGDAATWNKKTHTMYVLKNGVMFELVVELSDSSKEIAVATELSKMIIAACK